MDGQVEPVTAGCRYHAGGVVCAVYSRTFGCSVKQDVIGAAEVAEVASNLQCVYVCGSQLQKLGVV